MSPVDHRLAVAVAMAAVFGTYPPQDLIDDVDRAKAEDRRERLRRMEATKAAREARNVNRDREILARVKYRSERLLRKAFAAARRYHLPAPTGDEQTAIVQQVLDEVLGEGTHTIQDDGRIVPVHPAATDGQA